MQEGGNRLVLVSAIFERDRGNREQVRNIGYA
jgi:hypothetical protein